MHLRLKMSSTIMLGIKAKFQSFDSIINYQEIEIVFLPIDSCINFAYDSILGKVKTAAAEAQKRGFLLLDTSTLTCLCATHFVFY